MAVHFRGYHAWEAVCDPKGIDLTDSNQVFQVDENVNPRGEYKFRQRQRGRGILYLKAGKF